MKSKLIKHLQKSLCTEAVNLMVSFFSEENLSDITSNETRSKIIAKMNADLKNDFGKLNSSLNDVTLDVFLNDLEQCATKVDMMIKKVDSKREKLTLSEHKQSLIIQLSECHDPILSLHIAVLLAFLVTQNCMLHATGKFVPQILLFLQKHLQDDIYQALKECQEFIFQYVATKDDLEKDKIMKSLNSSMTLAKSLCVNLTAPKKS